MTGSATAAINAQDRHQVLNQGLGRETMFAVPDWAWNLEIFVISGRDCLFDQGQPAMEARFTSMRLYSLMS